MTETPICELICRVFTTRNFAHLAHWKTKSYAQHMALGDFYDSIIDDLDTFVEAYQGKYGLLVDYRPTFTLAEEPLSYMMFLKDELARCRASGNFPQDTELQNIADEIAALVDSTIYKLRFLK